MSTKTEKTESPFVFLWSQFSPEDQKDAAACFWKSKSSENHKEVATALGRILNFRDKFVLHRSLDWRVEELCKHLPHLQLKRHIKVVLREFLIARREEMIRAILDAEGTPHEGIWITKDADATAATPEVFVKGLIGVRGKYSNRDLLIYYFVNLGVNQHFEALEAAFETSEFRALVDSVFDSGEDNGAKAVETGTFPATAESNEEFTTLDNLLIKTVIASATGTDGALPSDALEDLVQEVLTLGVDRHRSYFHLGYLDAVLEKELRGELAGANVSRRGWYLTGFLMGRLRSVQAEQVVQLVKSHRKLWEELMHEGPVSARVMLLPSLLSRFAEAGEWRLLRELLECSHLPAESIRAMNVCRMAYEIAADLVRCGSPAEAVPLLQILLKHLENASELPKEFHDQIAAAALRKLGQAHLRAGRYGEAKNLLAEALRQPDFAEAANARTDLGLAEAGFRSLDFLLPKEDEKANETTVKALEKQAKKFEQSLSDEGRPTNAHFVLGLIAFHRKRNKEAEDHLSKSLAGMLQKEAAYQSAQLVDWTRFLLSVLIAEQCEQARLNEIRGHVECAIASPAFFPLHLWARLCRYLSLYDDQSLAETAIQHVLKKRGELGYALLKESGLLTKNAVLRTSYRQWLDSQKHPPAKKAAELEVLLGAAIADGATEEATEILDALEGVAKSDAGCIPQFLSLLKNRRGDIKAIWGENDIDVTEAALLERSGCLAECAEVLRKLFYRYRVDADWPTIEDLLEQIERLKVPEIDVNQLRAQVEHLRPAAGAELPVADALRGVSVLYVGGNEMQAQYEETIRKELEKRHPGLSVTFYFPGWDSNWNVHLEKVERLIPKNNVVVINNFVRTQFGRKLRALCGNKIPWRACTGHGRKSLIHSIEVAALWVTANERKS